MTHLPMSMYRHGYSMIHDIDAAAKLISLALLVAGVTAARSALSCAFALVYVAAVCYLAQIKLSEAFAFAVRLIWLFALIIITNAFFYAPGEALFSWWIFAPSFKGALHGVLIAYRAVLILILCNVLTLTTSPMKLTAGLESIFSPLRFAGLPTGRIALIISAAVQFVPALYADADMIREAQTARGSRFDSLSFFERTRAVPPIIVPVFVAAFRRAETLALALQARGYRPDAPHKAARLKLGLYDGAALTVSAALCALQLVVL